MKYLKTFEGFSINENEGTSVVETEVSKEIESLSQEDKEKVKSELLDIADRLGLNPEELADKEKVAAALEKESDLSIKESLVNEGLSDWWKRTKRKVYGWLAGLGATGTLGGIITAGIGAEMQSAAHNIADYTGQTVEPNQLAIIGLTATAIGVAALITGLVGSGQAGAAGSAAGSAMRQ